MRGNPVVTITTPTTTRKQRGHFVLETAHFLWGVTRFPRPHMVTGFWKRQNPVTRYGHIGHFWPKK